MYMCATSYNPQSNAKSPSPSPHLSPPPLSPSILSSTHRQPDRQTARQTDRQRETSLDCGKGDETRPGAGIMEADDRQVTSLHSPNVIPPSALDKPSIMKRYHNRRTTRKGVTARTPRMLTLHDTRFVECRWWNDGL